MEGLRKTTGTSHRIAGVPTDILTEHPSYTILERKLNTILFSDRIDWFVELGK
jgi:hypothetical protein